MKITPYAKQLLWIVAVLAPVAIFLYAFPGYIAKHTFFWVCLATLPVSVIKNTSRAFPFLICCFVLALLSLLLPTTIGIYTYMCCMILFVVQRRVGSIHVNGLVHAFLASPFFSYISSLVSFPIRIQLSKAVSHLLHFTGFENEIAGNVIRVNNQDFLVDQACSGMYLLGYGILFGTLILSIRIRKQTISTLSLLGYYALLLVFIIWGNLVRIYVLVAGNIEAGHWMHETVGLLLFVVQIILPFYCIVNRQSASINAEIPKKSASFNTFPRVYYLALTGILLLMISRSTDKEQQPPGLHLNSVSGFEVTQPTRDVIKLVNHESLIYIKKPVAAYRADHNPLICWSGSGYAFKQVETLSSGNTQVNFATLKKGDNTLYSCWWFESDVSRTANQWDWRWKAFKNKERFYLVNVTCNTKDQLKKQMTHLMAESILSKISHHDIN